MITTETLGIAVALIIIATPLINWALSKATTDTRIENLRKLVDDMEEDKVEVDVCELTSKRIQEDVCELKEDVKATRDTVAKIETKLEIYFTGKPL